ncbi:LolA family protein [Methylomonas sp. MgM2]
MRFRWFVLLMVLSIASWADDTIRPEVLARLRHAGPAKYQYRETRQMELLDAPVQTRGYMLTDAEGTLVKLQLEPSRVIMAIAGQSMFYWDSARKQRHTAPLSRGGVATQQIEVFRAILHGRIDELQSVYDFAAETKGKQWTLRLIPKPNHADASGIEIFGDTDDRQRKIFIRQADGDSTEYLISKANEDNAAQYTIPALLREVTGD